MKDWKRLIMAGVLMLIVGVVLVGTGIAFGGKRFIEFDQLLMKSENKPNEAVAIQNIDNQKVDAFDRLKIEADEAKVEVIKGKDYGLGFSNINTKHVNYAVQNGQLVITQKGKKHFSISFFGINIPDREGNHSAEGITVYIPENVKLKELDLKCGVGVVTLKDISVEDVSFEVGVGELNIKGVSTDKCLFKGGIGEINAREMITGPLDIKAGIGEINIQGIFNGDINITGGMGEVKVNAKGQRESFNYELEKGLGDMKLNGEAVWNTEENKNHADKTIRVKAGVGDIEINVNE